jgi:hydroxyacylglutathione hydrolase
MPLEIIRIPCLADNYVWLLREPARGCVAIVDPADPVPVMAVLEARGWTLDLVLNTHHHADHVGGNLALKRAQGCRIVGPRADRDRIPGIDRALGDGDILEFGDARATVLDVPGHTRGHIAFWFAADQALFCGDTLFALGCGRMFEGTAPQMWTSLRKLRALPDDTLVHCAHEYTQANARFARHVDPANAELAARSTAIDAARARGAPTVPSPLGLEKRTNPFLRADDPGFARSLGLDPADPAAVFGALRRSKDGFR